MVERERKIRVSSTHWRENDNRMDNEIVVECAEERCPFSSASNHPIVSNFNLNVFRASNNNNNNSKFSTEQKVFGLGVIFSVGNPNSNSLPNRTSEWKANSSTEHQFNELYRNPISIKSIYGRCAFFIGYIVRWKWKFLSQSNSFCSQSCCVYGRAWVRRLWATNMCVYVCCHLDAHFPMFLVH